MECFSIFFDNRNRFLIKGWIIYETHGRNSERGLQNLFSEMIDLNGYTLIVTGFPRSGTSMMMRMLEHAGIEIIADEEIVNHKTKHQPYGCAELKNVSKTLKEKKREDTENKVVKVVCPYSNGIPVDRPLKAIFMQRDINEIITSLLAMNTIWDENIPETIAWTRGYLGYLKVPVLYVKYWDAVKYPRSTALRIQDFLEVELDIDNMVKAVDRKARVRYKTDKSLLGADKEERILRMDAEAYKDLTVTEYRVGE